jgi:hypothetical protein
MTYEHALRTLDYLRGYLANNRLDPEAVNACDQLERGLQEGLVQYEPTELYEWEEEEAAHLAEMQRGYAQDR